MSVMYCHCSQTVQNKQTVDVCNVLSLFTNSTKQTNSSHVHQRQYRTACTRAVLYCTVTVHMYTRVQTVELVLHYSQSGRQQWSFESYILTCLLQFRTTYPDGADGHLFKMFYFKLFGQMSFLSRYIIVSFFTTRCL